MSKSKHMDKLCIAAIIAALVITCLFMNGGSIGISQKEHVLGYEDRIFDADAVHEIDIVMDDFDDFIENCENEEYYDCTVVIDDEKYTNIAIRAKGNTSLSSVRSMGSQRYSFKLEFDHYDDSMSYHGLDKLCLNNLIQDNTMMKDYIVYRMMGEFGVDSPLCSYAYITVNGEDWGLYLALEGVEDSFLERNYGTNAGELYKPDSMSFGGGRGNGRDFDMGDLGFDDGSQEKQSDDRKRPDGGKSMPKDGDRPPVGQGFGGMPGGDFDPGNMPEGSAEGFGFGGSGESFSFGNMFSGMGSDDVKLKYIDDDPDSYGNIFDSAKTKVSKADKKRLIESLKNLNEYSNLEETVDMDEVLRYFVVHNFVVNGDSYTGSMVHNYYLHESDGKLGMIPWDYNLAFGTFQGGNASQSVNQSIDSPISGGNADDRPMFGWILSDEKYTERYHGLFEDFIEEWIDKGKLKRMIEDTESLIGPYVEKDPSRFCTVEEFEKGTEALKQFVSLRGQAVANQLNGDSTNVDTAGLNISDMGTMNMGRGAGGRKDSFSFDMPEGNGGGSSPSDNGFPKEPFGQDGQIGPLNPFGSGDRQFDRSAIPDFNSMKFIGSDRSGWLLVAISAAVLVAGILVAAKKRI